MNERIRELRNALGLTQQDFAKKIGVKRNTVATYEMGRSIPSTSAISLICEKFDVSEEWLRSGKGEMFVQRLPEDEYTKAALMLKKDKDKLAMQAVVEYWKLSPQSKAAIKEYIMNIASKLIEEE